MAIFRCGCLLAALVAFCVCCWPASNKDLAILNAGVEQSEDAPFAPPDYTFLPGDLLYFTFEVGGFAIDSKQEGEVRKIALTYQAVPEDAAGVPLAVPATGEVNAELHPEDKNWMPKRRASFLIPSFVSAGEYHVHVTVKDAIGKREASADLPFHIGGVQIKPSPVITVENFRFLRNPDDRTPLQIPAYSPGDKIYAQFEMTGYKISPAKEYHLSYGLTVAGPDGKPFVQQPQAAELQSSSFYPAPFMPGDLALTTSANTAPGPYTVVLTVKDLIGNQSYESKYAFTIER